jgi:hypothetical protein
MRSAGPAAPSVTTVQAWLGNASAAETLDTDSHLWPIPMAGREPLSTPFSGQLADSVRTAAAL